MRFIITYTTTSKEKATTEPIDADEYALDGEDKWFVFKRYRKGSGLTPVLRIKADPVERIELDSDSPDDAGEVAALDEAAPEVARARPSSRLDGQPTSGSMRSLAGAILGSPLRTRICALACHRT